MLWRKIAGMAGAVLLALALPGVTNGPAGATAAPRPAACDQAPANPSSSQVSDLDQLAADWGVFCEPSPIDGGFATWQKQNVATPALDGQALECALTGGSPYSNIHCYRNLLPEPATVGITLTLAFQFSPGPGCTDLQTACAQALEFSASKWQSQLRYEWAVQWERVGGACPRWRYWDPSTPSRWVAFSPALPQTLLAGRWYRLLLVGEIRQGRAHYIYFDLHEQGAPSRLYIFGDLTAAPRADQTVDRLAVAVQLDGNSIQEPYSVVLDQVQLARSTRSLAVVSARRAYLPLVSTGTQIPNPGCSL